MTTMRSFPGLRTVTISVEFGTRKKLDGLKPYFAAEAERVRALSVIAAAGLTPREAAARRSRWAEEKDEQRRRGVLIDSMRALITGALTQEVVERGWDRLERYELPHQSRGRWPGSSQGSWPEKITVDLPADLVIAVHVGCWDVSKEAVGKLRDWKERHPEARPNRPSRPGCSPQALADYQYYSAKVLTTGEIWRGAVTRGLKRIESHLPSRR
ncbi:hypothetical protein I6J42_33710 (plasmid) [Streptomyces californicus]|uniref:Transposase n=1 Tax=Streptomyces californicus TaxID=67351 RepID=A0ABD7D8D9_9ACTN|nr:hypothetical protein [Streptomyces californicus]QRV39055.1 hypothetical protein I6J42_33710 [Streptomyces californicus]QRV52508.1 hypothetical protein I6J43_33730 [Streptomyces californicus]